MASAFGPAARTPAALALEQALERARVFHAERASNPILGGALERLAEWQSRRLADTYADLASDARYAEAIAFFREDLYGPGDYSRRDADLTRIVPMLTRLLPDPVVATVARAMELNALSHELDRDLIRHLPRADGLFGVDDYCRAFRRMGRDADRRRQIGLIVEVGRSLDRYVRQPMIRGALTMMRGPARVAGLGDLQAFLERGFSAFRRMDGAAIFLAAVAQRETALLDAIMAGASAPFTDPAGPL